MELQTDTVLAGAGCTGVITIPASALDIVTLELLEDALTDMERNPDVRVIVMVITESALSNFCEVQEHALDLHLAEVAHRVLRRIEECDKPTIGALGALGGGIAGGAALLLTLDIRLIADDVRIGMMAFTSGLGLFPGAGGVPRAMRQLTPCRAKELLLTGDDVSASEAVAIGLCNRSVPRAELVREALSLAARIGEHSAVILKTVKRKLRHDVDMPLAAALALDFALSRTMHQSGDPHAM